MLSKVPVCWTVIFAVRTSTALLFLLRSAMLDCNLAAASESIRLSARNIAGARDSLMLNVSETIRYRHNYGYYSPLIESDAAY